MKTLLPIISLIAGTLFIVIMSAPLFVKGQQGDDSFSADYSRPSVSFFITSYAGDGTSKNAAKSSEKINFSDKYFNHNLKNISFELPNNLKDKSYDDKKVLLNDYLLKNNIGREMVSKWFSRQENGMFNLNYIHECGMYDASDQDVLMSAAAKRGEAIMKDAGQNLVNKTFVMILSPKEFTSFDDKTSHGWRSGYDIFLFKLNFDNDVVDRFYKVWPYSDDLEEIKRTKIATFDTLTFSFSYVYGKPSCSSSAMELYALTDNPKSSAQLFDDMVTDMYNDAMFKIDKDLEAFRVKINVSGTHPIRSKIGKKEGLRCEQRYFIYEFVWDEKTNKAIENRKAVVRATGTIADNRSVASGSSSESEFYQTYGGTIKQGMVMQQRNDLGMSVLAGYGFGGIAGFEAGLWIRTGFFTTVPSLYVFADLGVDAGDFAPPEYEETNYSFFRYSVGMGKGIRFARIGEITPYLAWGAESTSNDSLQIIRSNYIKGGGMLGINITHNVSLIGQISYYFPIGNVSTQLQDSEDEAVEQDYQWIDKFEGREGITMMFGLRLEF
jgi:hypothetical protein